MRSRRGRIQFFLARRRAQLPVDRRGPGHFHASGDSAADRNKHLATALTHRTAMRESMMSTASLAPIKRAATFFGAMGLLVAALTTGAAFQGAGDQSSTAVAQAKLREGVAVTSTVAASRVAPAKPRDDARIEARIPGATVLR
jgi:hypothetical protein